MTTKLTLSIPGDPKGKGRPRAVPRIVYEDGEPKAVVSLITPADTREEEARVRNLFRRKYPDHRPWTGPVLIRFTAVFETPKSFNKAQKEAAARGELMATRKPDKDNIEKLIVDALNNVAWLDDQQVMGGGVKRYGSPARVDVSMELMRGVDQPATPGEKRAEARLQGQLDLRPEKARSAPAHNAVSGKVDLNKWGPKTRRLIEAALERDERAKRERKR